MGERTKIAWCDRTFNPWIGCERISPGCDHCYAATQDSFRHWTPEGWGGPRKRTSASNWLQVKRWARETFFECKSCGWRGGENDLLLRGGGHCCRAMALVPTRARVFCASLADVFDNAVPESWRTDLWGLIHETPQLQWLLLTKRIGNARKMLPQSWLHQPVLGQLSDWPEHVRIGATFVNQEEVNRDMRKLLGLGVPNFASLEPLLGPIRLDDVRTTPPHDDWTYDDNALTGFIAHKNGGYSGKPLDWVIVGGESGGKEARPMHPDWAYSLREQCRAHGVPFFFKQWGEWAHAGLPVFGRVRPDAQAYINIRGQFVEASQDEDADCLTMLRVGKERAGELLGGEVVQEFPA